MALSTTYFVTSILKLTLYASSPEQKNISFALFFHYFFYLLLLFTEFIQVRFVSEFFPFTYLFYNHHEVVRFWLTLVLTQCLSSAVDKK